MPRSNSLRKGLPPHRSTNLAGPPGHLHTGHRRHGSRQALYGFDLVALSRGAWRLARRCLSDLREFGPKHATAKVFPAQSCALILNIDHYNPLLTEKESESIFAYDQNAPGARRLELSFGCWLAIK